MRDCIRIPLLSIIIILWSSFSVGYGLIPDENCSIAFSKSTHYCGQFLQQPSRHISTASNWTVMFDIIFNNPPKAPIMPWGNVSGIPGINYSYFTSAIDPDENQVRYIFDWGDGTNSIIGPVDSGTISSSSHKWIKGGTYQVKANAIDSKGSTSRWSEPLNVTINTPPGGPSAPSGPSSGRIGIPQTYSVSAIDPDGDQINYTIDWGDGTTLIVGPMDSGAYAIVKHTWTKAGIYQVKAAATDSIGSTSRWSEQWAVIINAPPNRPSKPSGPISVYAWALTSYSTFVTDPDNDSMNCSFDWGDGNRSITNLIPSGGNVSAVHSWSDEGDYRIKVVAIDGSKDASGWSDYLTISVISNGRPNVPIDLFGPSSGYTGIAHSYFTLADDPDNDKVKYTFDWGDRTHSTTDIVNPGSVESASHAWSKAGTYQVRCNSTDSKGASSTWSKPLNVTIAENHPPAIPTMPSGLTSGRCLIAYEYATSATDPEGDNVRYVIDWGDGTTSWTGVDFINSGITEGLSHKWSKTGKYQVKAMAMDDKGASSGWSIALVINIS